jgi:hypothetical protein
MYRRANVGVSLSELCWRIPTTIATVFHNPNNGLGEFTIGQSDTRRSALFDLHCPEHRLTSEAYALRR